MENGGWDLQAVVKGCCGTTPATAMADPFCSFSPLLLPEGCGEEDDLLFSFQDIFGAETEIHLLEDLWKPFFPNSPQHQNQLQQQQQQQTLLSPQGSSSPQLSVGGGGESVLVPLPQPPARQQQRRTPPHTPRPKRRKNQQKKVVCQVPADGVSADMWAWRKYGQKPIKGSPYPRGYYRCSSSKGCIARKQVERSRTEPGTLVITYTGEHNHPLPTHRNSLAGSTRQKFPSASSPASSPPEQQPDCRASPSSTPLSSPSAGGLSPTTPLTDSMEEELHLHLPQGGGAEEDEVLFVGDMDMVAEDEVLFLGLEELDKLNAGELNDVFSDHFGVFPVPWMGNNTATAADGR